MHFSFRSKMGRKFIVWKKLKSISRKICLKMNQYIKGKVIISMHFNFIVKISIGKGLAYMTNLIIIFYRLFITPPPPITKKHGIYRHLLKAYRNITNILKNFILHKFIYSKPMRHSLTLQKYCGDTENRLKKSDALSYVLVVK